MTLVACSSKASEPVTTGSGGSAMVIVKADAATGPVVPVGPDGLPIVCGDWKAAIDKLATCDALPKQDRESLIAVYTQTSAGWGTLPADAKQHLVAVCKAGADSILKGAAATCGWQ